MPFFFDPTFVLLLPALLFAAYAQIKVSRSFARYAQVGTVRGLALRSPAA